MGRGKDLGWIEPLRLKRLTGTSKCPHVINCLSSKQMVPPFVSGFLAGLGLVVPHFSLCGAKSSAFFLSSSFFKQFMLQPGRH